MSFSAIHLRNRYGIYLRRKRSRVRVRYSIAPEKNAGRFFREKLPLFRLDYWRKNAKISNRLEKT